MTDPLWIDASAGAPAYSSAELRRLMAVAHLYNGRVLGARQGVRPGGTALDTTIAGTTITVKAGLAVVDPALTTTQGPYWVVIATDETFTLTAAHATLPRKDITILRVYDHTEDSSGLRKAQSEYLVGTAAGSPAEPAVPAGAFRLATIDVPPSGGGSPVITINKPFTVASGGILPVRDATERGLITPFDCMAICRMDRDWVEIYDGAAWRVQGLAVCSSTSDRDSAITSPYNGMFAVTTDTGILYQRQAGAWQEFIRTFRAVTAATTSSGTIGTSEAVVLTISNFVFKANRAYRISWFGGWDDVSGAPADVNTNVRKTDQAGAQWIAFGWQRVISGSSKVTALGGAGYVRRNAGSDLTATFVLSAAMDTGQGLMYADSTLRRWMLIEECGAAADFATIAFDVT